MRANQGFVTMADLAAYRAQGRQPILLDSHGYKLALNPPRAIGGAMVSSMVQMYDSLWRPGMTGAERALAIARVQQAMCSLRQQEANASWGATRR